MSPRPYNLGKRQDLIQQGRRQVLDAARALLGDVTSYAGFTVDAVARRADVARATVYYQFRSKSALLEAVCDDLAQAGGMDELPAVFMEPEPEQAWRRFVGAFGRFWDADRTAMRRLRALAALDPEVGEVIAARDARRRQGIDVLLGRMDVPPRGPDRSVVAGQLFVLTSFETFDGLAGADGSLLGVVDQVVALTESVIGRASASRTR